MGDRLRNSSSLISACAAALVAMTGSSAFAVSIDLADRFAVTEASYGRFLGGVFTLESRAEESDSSTQRGLWNADVESRIDPIVFGPGESDRTREALARASVDSQVSSSGVMFESQLEVGWETYSDPVPLAAGGGLYYTDRLARTRLDLIFEITTATAFSILVEGKTSSTAIRPAGSVVLEHYLPMVNVPAVFSTDVQFLRQGSPENFSGVLAPGQYRFQIRHEINQRSGGFYPHESTLTALLSVPEPGTAVLMFMGLFVLGFRPAASS